MSHYICTESTIITFFVSHPVFQQTAPHSGPGSPTDMLHSGLPMVHLLSVIPFSVKFCFFLNPVKNDLCRMRTKSHLFVHHYHRSYWKATRAQIVPGQSRLMRCDTRSLKNTNEFDIHLDPSPRLCSCFRESTATLLITGEETVSLTSLM